MILAGLDYESVRELVLGINLQHAVLYELSSTNFKIVIGAALMFGMLIHIGRIYAKQESLPSLVGYSVLAPIMMHFALQTMVPITSVSTPFKPSMQAEEQAAQQQVTADKTAYSQYESDVKNGKVPPNPGLDAHLRDTIARDTDRYNKDKLLVDSTKPASMMSVSALFDIYYTVTGDLRWMIAGAIANSIHDKNGNTYSDPNTAMQEQEVMKASFIQQAQRTPNLTEGQKYAVKQFNNCMDAEAYFKQRFAQSAANWLNTMKNNASAGGGASKALSATEGNPDFNGDMTTLGNQAMQAYSACTGGYAAFLKNAQNDKAIVARANDLESGWLGTSVGSGLSADQKSLIAKVYNIPANDMAGLTDHQLAMLLAEYEAAEQISTQVNSATPASVNDPSQVFGNLGHNPGGAAEGASSWVGRLMSGFWMYGKTLSIESYHFVLFLVPLAYVFCMLGALIPGFHTKMLGGFFAGMLFVQMWGLGYGLVDVYNAEQYSRSLSANMTPPENSYQYGGISGLWDEAKGYISAGDKWAENKISSDLSDIMTYGIGAYISGNIASSAAGYNGVTGAMKGILSTAADSAGVGAAGGVATGIIAADLASLEKDSAIVKSQNATLQEIAGRVAQMDPMMQTVYNGMIQWQNARMQYTIRDLQATYAMLYTMVPFIVSFVFFGLWKVGGMMDLGQQGQRVGAQAAAMLMMAGRFGGGGRQSRDSKGA